MVAKTLGIPRTPMLMVSAVMTVGELSVFFHLPPKLSRLKRRLSTYGVLLACRADGDIISRVSGHLKLP
jgi:hypothetical protein